MDHVKILPEDILGKYFIPNEYLPKGKTEFYLRNKQIAYAKDSWRHLCSEEVERLVKNNNTAENWDDILVAEPFDTGQIKNNEFFGLVRIGKVQYAILEHHDLQLPVGITNSLIISCDIGNQTAIHNVRYLAHYIIGNRCILANIDEMHTTNHAKFGNGILKEGEPEKIRIWLDVMNEAGCRGILPFDGIIPADGYLWAKYREDSTLMTKLKDITQKSFDSRRGYYGTVGDQCVVKNSRILKDVKIGPHSYIKGANKLKNLTINSSEEEPIQIGEGVELVNGIVGYGCHIFYGCKAVRFILGNNSNLKYGARLINSFLGDNSTISCCEVLNNLIFPAHEQHHNNSFLIASLVQGQSNMAAGATVGSNHNSRANDNEVQAGRGFWPGLCSSLKHSSRFVSFMLIAKGDYPEELDVRLPFSLLNNNVSKDRLEVMPAFWWLYNMYALARNTWKFQNRDKRKKKIQHIEFDALAPDTVEEIFIALGLLELWTAKAYIKESNKRVSPSNKNEYRKLGCELIFNKPDEVKQLEILGENVEKSRRKVVIIKVLEAYHAYRDMLHYYAIKNCIDYLIVNSDKDFSGMSQALKGKRENKWVNLGGQIITETDVDSLRKDIGIGKLDTWEKIHKRYDLLWNHYPLKKQQHAFCTFCDLLEIENPSKEQWILALDEAVRIQNFINEQVYISRKKDYDNPFRQATYRNINEMTAAIGTIEDNSFVRQVREETEEFKKLISKIKKRS